VLTFVVSRPADAKALPAASKSPGQRADVLSGRLLTRREMLRQPTFWLILLGNGIFVAAGATMAIILVPYAQAKNIGLEWAAVALSCYGLGSMIGSPIWGYIVDRAGPSRTFVALAAIEATMWGCLYLFGGNAMMIMLVGGLVGFCSGGAAVPLLTATIGIWVDRQNFSRALGLLYFLKLPFSAGMPILSGVIFDVSGSYQMLLLIFVGLMALNIILFSLFQVRPFGTPDKGGGPERHLPNFDPSRGSD
jgi:MFS family permease